MLYPLSYEGGVRLSPHGYQARLPILAGSGPGLLAGPDLRESDTGLRAGVGPSSAARGEPCATAAEPGAAQAAASQRGPSQAATG